VTDRTFTRPLRVNKDNGPSHRVFSGYSIYPLNASLNNARRIEMREFNPVTAYVLQQRVRGKADACYS
jgi:hypothetical protein